MYACLSDRIALKNHIPTNRLIDLLTLPERRAFLADMTTTSVRAHDRLSLRGTALPSVFFPVGAVISAVCVSEGAEMEVHGVGREGMIGGQDLFASKRSRFDLVCQIGGGILSMSSLAFGQRLKSSSELRQILSTYSTGVLTFMTQSVACNGLHSVAQRCARWLLVTRDRVGAVEFSLTHELLARMLGVRRSSVSVAISRFAHLDLVRYRFGRVRIVDLRGLASESCDCYRVVVRETRRLQRARAT